MSLRIRLALRDVILTTLGLVILGVVIYSVTTLIVLDRIDQRLLSVAGDVINQLRMEAPGRFNVSVFDTYELPNQYTGQIWGMNRRLQYSTYSGTQAPLDPGGWDSASPTFTFNTWKQDQMRVLSVPLETARGWAGVVMIGISTSWLIIAQQDLGSVLAAAIFVLFILLIAILWYLNGRMLLPLVQIVNKMDELNKSNDLSIRLPVRETSTDEVGDVARSFNQALDRMENILNMQRRFVTDVSHELRTPLTVIKGEVGLLRKIGNADPDSLYSIESEVDRLTRMVGDILLLSQAESGRMPLNLGRLDVDELVLDVYHQTQILAGKGIKYILGELEPVQIIGDWDRMKQVLLNLVGNAISNTPAGGQVSISTFKMGEQAHILVNDTGEGIPEEDIPHIFDRFYRSERSRRRKKGESGFGLGLSISYWIVRNHNGTIEVSSQVGKGTTFVVILPLVKD